MTYIHEARHSGKPDNGLSPAMAAMHVGLCELIRAAQQDSPFLHVGQVWAKPVSQDGWCRASGLKLRTFQELVKVAPIRRYNCNLHGGKVTLLRVGEPGPEEHRVLAKQMTAYFLVAAKEAKLALLERKRLKQIEKAEAAESPRGKANANKCAARIAAEKDKVAAAKPEISRAEFGMLCGLAADFPDGWQMDIFKHAVIRWPDFMDMVKMEVAIALELRDMGLDPFAPEVLDDHLLTTARRYHDCPERLKAKRVYQLPFIPLLRAFWPVAVDLFIDDRQFRGDVHPASVWPRWSEQAYCHAVSTFTPYAVSTS